jgi:hypothetical protein
MPTDFQIVVDKTEKTHSGGDGPGKPDRAQENLEPTTGLEPVTC